MRVSNSVRRIRPDEGDEFRAIRLRALAEDPEAFGAPLGTEAAFESEFWTERAAEASDGGASAVFFIEIDTRIEAMVGAYVSGGVYATLWGMWVVPELRGTGAAIGLVDAVEVWAVDNSLDHVELCYFEDNDAAGRFYARLGYRPSGQPNRGTAPGCGPEVSLTKELPASTDPAPTPA